MNRENWPNIVDELLFIIKLVEFRFPFQQSLIWTIDCFQLKDKLAGYVYLKLPDNIDKLFSIGKPVISLFTRDTIHCSN